MAFSHEKLDVYRSALRFLALVHATFPSTAKARPELSDQIDRAALSIVLNIAEGAGEFSAPDKRRFYRFALRSAHECAAALDAAVIRQVLEAHARTKLAAELDRTIAMLTRLATRREK